MGKRSKLPDTTKPDFVADYTTMQVGAGVGTGKVLVACPKCQKPGVIHETTRSRRCVHVVELRGGVGGAKQKVASFCKLEPPR